MGIDVFFCKQAGGEIEQDGRGDRVANVDAFLATAFTFGMTLESIRHLAAAPPERMKELIPPAVAAFEEYLEQNSAKGLEQFANYFNFVRDTMQEAAKGKKSIDGPSLYEQLPLESVEEDARAFFGWFMLTERVIEPEEAGIIAPILGLARGALNHFATQTENDNPDLAAMIRDGYVVLGTVAEFCDEAVEKSKPFCFSF